MRGVPVTRAWAWLRHHKDALFLVVFILVVCGLVLVRATSNDETTRHDFCGIVTAFIARPVPRPNDPAANPSREQNYQWYLKFVRLDHQLGCS